MGKVVKDKGDIVSRPAVLVTGGARGLGREIVLRFARGGWNVVVNCFRSVEQADEVAEQVRALGSDAIVVCADVVDASAHGMLVGAALERWGRLDCLVNNAAIIRNCSVVKLNEVHWEELMATNLFAPIRLARRAAQVMRPGSSITNIISICGLWGCAFTSAYSTSKSALAGFTSAAAAEFSGSGVRINAVAPGYMPTAMGNAAPNAAEKARLQHAMGVLSDPRAAAGFVFQLAHMPWISGQVFNVDGRIR